MTYPSKKEQKLYVIGFGRKEQPGLSELFDLFHLHLFNYNFQILKQISVVRPIHCARKYKKPKDGKQAITRRHNNFEYAQSLWTLAIFNFGIWIVRYDPMAWRKKDLSKG